MLAYVELSTVITWLASPTEARPVATFELQPGVTVAPAGEVVVDASEVVALTLDVVVWVVVVWVLVVWVVAVSIVELPMVLVVPKGIPAGGAA